MARNYFNRGSFLATSPRREYPATQEDTRQYTPIELPLPKPVKEPNLSGLGLLIMGLLNTKLEVIIVSGKNN